MTSPFHQAALKQSQPQSPFHQAAQQKTSTLTPGQEAKYGDEFDILSKMKKPDTGFFEQAANIYALSDDDIAPEIIHPAEAAKGAKGVASGLTLGISENIPGFKGEGAAFETGKFFGSLAPISKIANFFGKPLANAAMKSPVFQKQLTSLANITTSVATGASVKGIETAAKGEMPSMGDMLEHGAAWGLLDAALQATGKVGQFTSKLLRRSEQVKKPSWKVVNDLLSDMKKEGLPLSDKERVTAKALSVLEEPTGKAGQALPAAERIATKKPTLTENTALAQRIEKLAPRAETEKALGESIQRDIENQRSFARSEYEPLYNRVRGVAKDIRWNASSAAKLAGDTLMNLERFSTETAGYAPTRKILENFLDDLGYTVQRDADNLITSITAPKQGGATLADIHELSRRLSEASDYESLEKSIKDILKPLSALSKQEVKRGLQQNSPLAAKLFDKAEKLYGDFAQKLGRDSIKGIRQLQSTEDVAKLIQKPTAIQDMKKILSPRQYAQVEREIIEQLSTQNADKAAKSLREIKPYITPQARQVANELVKQKHFEEFTNKFVAKDGSLDFAKLNEQLKNPKAIKSIKELGGDSAVEFFRNLESTNNQIKRNADLLSKIYVPKEASRGESKIRALKQKSEAQKPAIDKLTDFVESNIGIPKGKTLTTLYLATGAVLAPVVGTKGAAISVLLYYASRNPKVRQAIKNFATARVNPSKYAEYFPLLENALMNAQDEEATQS